MSPGHQNCSESLKARAQPVLNPPGAAGRSAATPGLPRKLSRVWNYVSVMTCNPTARVDGDGDGLKIRVVAVRDPDVVVDKGDRFEAPQYTAMI